MQEMYCLPRRYEFRMKTNLKSVREDIWIFTGDSVRLEIYDVIDIFTKYDARNKLDFRLVRRQRDILNGPEGIEIIEVDNSQ